MERNPFIWGEFSALCFSADYLWDRFAVMELGC